MLSLSGLRILFGLLRPTDVNTNAITLKNMEKKPQILSGLHSSMTGTQKLIWTKKEAFNHRFCDRMRRKLLFGHRHVAFVWRKIGEALNSISMFKHVIVNAMLWVFFVVFFFKLSGLGNLVKVSGIIRKDDHFKILQENIRQSEDKLGLGHHWTFQQDSDPKRTPREVKKWLTEKISTFWHDPARVQT